MTVHDATSLAVPLVACAGALGAAATAALRVALTLGEVRASQADIRADLMRLEVRLDALVRSPGHGGAGAERVARSVRTDVDISV